MQFKLIPTLSLIEALYSIPVGKARFKAYLELLQGETKGDLVLPIGNYNPMAKPLLLDRIRELRQLNAEEILEQTLEKVNKEMASKGDDRTFGVAINLADDLLGGWTNRFTTDYDTRFKLQALIKREFCVAILWSSEEFSSSRLEERISAACFRTMHRSLHEHPVTLEMHLIQELFVARHTLTDKSEEVDEEWLGNYYRQHKDSDDYHRIFNFFYGDGASASIGFPEFGVKDENAGWNYIRSVLRSGE